MTHRTRDAAPQVVASKQEADGGRALMIDDAGDKPPRFTILFSAGLCDTFRGALAAASAEAMRMRSRDDGRAPIERIGAT